MAKSGGIDLSSLSVQDLAMLRESLEKDLERFGQFMETLGRAASRYGASANALESLKDEEQAYWQPEASDAGKTMLVPLTSSMYVRGTLDTTEQVLVDIGTGYLAEKSLEEAVEFCRRKVGMLKEKIESTQQTIREKQGAFLQVRSVYQQKVAAEASRAGQSGVPSQ